VESQRTRNLYFYVFGKMVETFRFVCSSAALLKKKKFQNAQIKLTNTETFCVNSKVYFFEVFLCWHREKEIFDRNGETVWKANIEVCEKMWVPRKPYTLRSETLLTRSGIDEMGKNVVNGIWHFCFGRQTVFTTFCKRRGERATILGRSFWWMEEAWVEEVWEEVEWI
jgi:hypothetical protein